MSFLLMKKLSASLLAVDTKLLLKGSLCPGGPAGISAVPLMDNVLPQTRCRGSLQKAPLHIRFWVNMRNS